MPSSDELRESVRRIYSSRGEVVRYRDRVDEGLRRWEQAIVAGHLVPTRLLVIGCGGGREAFALEALGYEVTGIDLVDQQVDSARSSARRRASVACFRSYDGNSIPFPNESFGAVTMWSQVLGNVPGSSRRLALLQEAHRVLCRGCVLSLSVHDREKSMAALGESSSYRYRLPTPAEPGDVMVRVPSGQECYWHYFDTDELIQLCRKAGFASVHVQTTADLGEAWDNVLVAVCR